MIHILLQDGSPHLPEAAVREPDPEGLQSSTSETGAQCVVTSLPHTTALSATVATPGISHPSEAGQAAEPVHQGQEDSPMTGQVDSDHTQDKTDGTVVMSLLCVDTPSACREDR